MHAEKVKVGQAGLRTNQSLRKGELDMNEKTRKQSGKLRRRGGAFSLLLIVFLGGWWWFFQGGSKKPPEQGVLDIWTTWGDTPEVLEELLTPFTAAQGIEIRISSRIHLNDLNESFTSGEEPDLVILSASDPIQQYFDQGWVHPLEEWYQAAGSDRDNVFPAALERCQTTGDQLACVPLGIDVMTLYWNRELFSAAGLDPDMPPESVDELAGFARMLTLRNQDGQLIQAGFIPDMPAPHSELYAAALSNGLPVSGGAGSVSTVQATQSAEAWLLQTTGLSDPEEIEAFIKSFTPYGSSKHPVFSDRRLSCHQCHRTTNFEHKSIPAHGLTNGNVAMMVDGSWGLISAERMDAALIGSAPFPAPAPGLGLKGSVATDGPVVFIPAHGQDRQVALDLLRWIMTPEFQVEATQALSLLPVTVEAANHEHFQASGELRMLIALVSGS
jgi:ABC-type glycerol-3-phosphate transport system substrate-binding protein